jgi:hypothetical protein
MPVSKRTSSRSYFLVAYRSFLIPQALHLSYVYRLQHPPLAPNYHIDLPAQCVLAFRYGRRCRSICPSRSPHPTGWRCPSSSRGPTELASSESPQSRRSRMGVIDYPDGRLGYYIHHIHCPYVGAVGGGQERWTGRYLDEHCHVTSVWPHNICCTRYVDTTRREFH